MDEDTAKLLTGWGLQDYLDIFADNKISLNTLALLDKELAKELIKPIGDRAKFLKELEGWRILTNTPPSEPMEIEDSFVDILNSSHRLGSLSEVLRKCESPSVSVDSGAENNENRIVLIDVTNEREIQDSQTKPLKEILKKTNEGRGLLNLYESEGKLSSNGRRKLCNIIIKDILEQDPYKRVDSKTLFEYAQQVKDVFCKENISTYFIPYINNSKLKIKRCAKGKLYDCLQNRRRELRQSKIITKSNETTSTPTSPLPGSSADENLTSSDDIIWLQNASDPWHTVMQKWKDTAKFRLAEIKDGGVTINEYMDKYPALKTPTGYQLLVEDFKVLYPGYEENLFENFALYKTQIIELALKKCINTQDSTIQQIIKTCKEQLQGEENSNISAFMLLPLVIGNPLAKNKKATWRPSKQETRDGFITHVIRPMDVQDTLNRRKEKYVKLGVTFQPTIVIVGPNYSEIDKYYVVVNNTFYEVDTILKAVDICFKIYHSLHSEYPVESVSIWTFLQKGLYKIKTPWDKCFTTVSAFMSDLGIEE